MSATAAGNVQGTLHPAVLCLGHHLQAWVPERQAQGQALLLVRALVEAGLIAGAEIHNGIPFVVGTVRRADMATDLNSGQVQISPVPVAA